MFAITANESADESEDMLNDIVGIQEHLYTSLDLHYKLLDMPPSDLGAPAYRKYDIEAWMPGRQIYGEISSASNCTDYQSRRLGIKYRNKDGKVKYAHTVNGTAVASPRILIALMECLQEKYEKSSAIRIPDVLRKYMKSDYITRQEKIKMRYTKR